MGSYAMGFQAEELRVVSGEVLAIDQFMLGNEQLLQGLEATKEGVARFGGAVLPMAEGIWKVYRFPREKAFVLTPKSVPEDALPAILDEAMQGFEVRGKTELLDRPVFVETRCVVFLDWKTARDPEVMGHFRELRKDGKDKEARDFLREKGAAVRYGFSQESDELKSFLLQPEGAVVFLG